LQEEKQEMIRHASALPSNWPEFRGCIQKTLLYAYQRHKPRTHLPRFTHELKRLLALYPECGDPHVVADLMNQIWKNYPEVRGEEFAQ